MSAVSDFPAPAAPPSDLRVLLLGGTGTIGRATARALVAAGHRVTALVRPSSRNAVLPPEVTLRTGPVGGRGTLASAMTGQDAVISCLASRTGAPADAWAIDHDAHVAALAAATDAGVPRFVLLSAICVQKPRLAFQHAKLAFEAKLRAAPLAWSIVRPTAYFKSLSGQLARLQAGKPYLIFGDGRLTACKPISDGDLGRYLTLCLTDPDLQGRILPIGGPGPALTPRDIGEMLFDLLGKPPRFRSAPPGLLRTVAAALSLAGRLSPKAAEKAELARIGHYYATESMLVWDEAAGRYDADATPEFGRETLRDHLAALISGSLTDERGAHAVF